MELTAGVVIVAVVATLAGATIQGSIGFGMNLVTVPALALVLPEALPVAVIVLGFPLSLGMVRHERQDVDWPGFAWITAGRLPGTIIGAGVVAAVSTTALQALAGTVVILLALASSLLPPLPVRARTQATAGLVSGITGTSAGIGGPPLALLYQHHSGPIMRSTLAASFLLGTFMSLSTLTLAGQVRLEAFVLGACLSPVVVLGSTLGRRLHGWLDGGWLRPAVLCFAFLAGATVLADAMT